MKIITNERQKTARLQCILNDSSLCAVWLQMSFQEWGLQAGRAAKTDVVGSFSSRLGRRNRSSDYGRLEKKNSLVTIFFV